MRRRVPDGGVIKGKMPASMLLTFEADDWPGENPSEQFAAFLAARDVHRARHGWPGGEEGWWATFPDQPWWVGIV